MYSVKFGSSILQTSLNHDTCWTSTSPCRYSSAAQWPKLASKSSAQCHQVFSPVWEILSQFWLYKISEVLECQGQDLDRQDDHPRRRGRVTWLCPIKVTTWYVQTIGNPHESTGWRVSPSPSIFACYDALTLTFNTSIIFYLSAHCSMYEASQLHSNVHAGS